MNVKSQKIDELLAPIFAQLPISQEEFTTAIAAINENFIRLHQRLDKLEVK